MKGCGGAPVTRIQICVITIKIRTKQGHIESKKAFFFKREELTGWFCSSELTFIHSLTIMELNKSKKSNGIISVVLNGGWKSVNKGCFTAGLFQCELIYFENIIRKQVGFWTSISHKASGCTWMHI